MSDTTQLKTILAQIGSSDASYAQAAQSVLVSVSAAKPTGIALGETTRNIMGTMGIPDSEVHTQDELIALLEALSIVIQSLTSGEDEDDTADISAQYILDFRETYGNLTDEQISDLIDPTMFETMNKLKRQAAVYVLMDIAVDRGIRIAPIWTQISNSVGIQE